MNNADHIRAHVHSFNHLEEIRSRDLEAVSREMGTTGSCTEYRGYPVLVGMHRDRSQRQSTIAKSQSPGRKAPSVQLLHQDHLTNPEK